MTIQESTICSLVQTFPILLILAQNHNKCLKTPLIYKPPTPTPSPEYYEALEALFQSLYGHGYHGYEHECNHGHGTYGHGTDGHGTYGHGTYGYGKKWNQNHGYDGHGYGHTKPCYPSSYPTYGHGYQINTGATGYGHPGTTYGYHGYKKVNIYNISAGTHGYKGYAPTQVYNVNHKYKVVVKKNKGRLNKRRPQKLQSLGFPNQRGDRRYPSSIGFTQNFIPNIRERLTSVLHLQPQNRPNEYVYPFNNNRPITNPNEYEFHYDQYGRPISYPQQYPGNNYDFYPRPGPPTWGNNGGNGNWQNNPGQWQNNPGQWQNNPGQWQNNGRETQNVNFPTDKPVEPTEPPLIANGDQGTNDNFDENKPGLPTAPIADGDYNDGKSPNGVNFPSSNDSGIPALPPLAPVATEAPVLPTLTPVPGSQDVVMTEKPSELPPLTPVFTEKPLDLPPLTPVPSDPNQPAFTTSKPTTLPPLMPVFTEKPLDLPPLTPVPSDPNQPAFTTSKQTTLPPLTPVPATESRYNFNFGPAGLFSDPCELDGESGYCVPIYNCDQFVKLLHQSRSNPALVRMLRAAHCGFEGNNPKVCCPGQAQPIPTAPPPTFPPAPTEPPTQPPTQPTAKPEEKAADTDGSDYVSSLPEPPDCGFSNATLGRVVGGVDARLGDFPWMTLLGYKKPSHTAWLCGGTLVSSKHVLTAAHCIYGQEKSLYVVRFGEHDLAREDEGATPVDVLIKRAIKHEEYSREHLTNDIGILVLQQVVEYSALIKPICLPQSAELRATTFENYTPLIAGWGATEFRGPSATILQVLQLPVVSNEFCQNAYKAYTKQVIDERVVCAGYKAGKKDACQGDSGGPLMQPILMHNKVNFYQIGVVSYGKKCAEPGFPGVYTRVTEFIPWLQDKILGPA